MVCSGVVNEHCADGATVVTAGLERNQLQLVARRRGSSSIYTRRDSGFRAVPTPSGMQKARAVIRKCCTAAALSVLLRRTQQLLPTR